MISFGHTAVGVMVGITAQQYFGQDNLFTGLIITGGAGFISHYVMDFIPHGHFKMVGGYKKGILPIIVFDLSLSIILFLGTIYLKEGFSQKFLYALFGVGGSQLPDVIDGLIYTNIIKAKGLARLENNIHEGLHWHGRRKKILLLSWWDIWQVLVVLASLFLVLK